MFVLGNFFDELLGELQKDTITTFYGPPGSGKSTVCFQYVVSCLRAGKKVVYVDTEGGFSCERILQIYPGASLKDVIVFSPKSFEEQGKVIVELNKMIGEDSDIGLVVVDSLVMLYRLKLGDSPQRVNSELGEQLRLLNEISRSFGIPILVINQMYKDFETRESRMVGGSLVEYWSKTIVELDCDLDVRKAVLRKHKFRRGGEEKRYEIGNNGLFEVRGRSFKLFG